MKNYLPESGLVGLAIWNMFSRYVHFIGKSEHITCLARKIRPFNQAQGRVLLTGMPFLQHVHHIL
jgi:hypothetical protein